MVEGARHAPGHHPRRPHAWAWSLGGDERLSPAALAAMAAADTVLVSLITFFEIGQTVRLGTRVVYADTILLQ